MKHFVIGAALLAVAGCGGEQPSSEADQQEPVNVTVSELVRGAADRVFPARVVAGDEAAIATRASGRISTIAELGTRVRAGQVLVRIEDADLQAGVDQAEAAWELATATTDRIRALNADGAASMQELDEAESRLAQALAGLEGARAQLAYTSVTAPFSGTVSRRLAQKGALVTPGQEVLRLSGEGQELRLDLPAEMRDLVRAGTRGRLQDGSEITVLRVGSSLDAASRRFAVETSAPASLGAGTLVDVAFPTAEAGQVDAEQRVSWLPDDAIVRRGQLTGVFTVESDTLRLRWVRLGRVRGAAVELLAGPAGLTQVVREPGTGVVDGRPAGTVSSWAFAIDAGGDR